MNTLQVISYLYAPLAIWGPTGMAGCTTTVHLNKRVYIELDVHALRNKERENHYCRTLRICNEFNSTNDAVWRRTRIPFGCF